MATTLVSKAAPRSEHPWRPREGNDAGSIGAAEVAVNTPAPVEVIVRAPRIDHDGWSLWWNDGQSSRHPYTVLIQGGGEGEVKVACEWSKCRAGLGIEADGHVVCIEHLRAGDLRELAADAGAMLKYMVDAEDHYLSWQFKWGELCVEWSDWSREMVEAFRDRVEALADEVALATVNAALKGSG